MAKNFFLLALSLFIVLISCKSLNNQETYSSDTLKIIKLSKNTFVHVSYLETEDYGKVACNGLVYASNNEAIVFDTPANENATDELINWIENTMRNKIKVLVVNHHHSDCMAGISKFTEKNIPSYAHQKTIQLIKEPGMLPTNSFDKELILTVGGHEIKNNYFGEAHTVDNIISYIPDEELIYGGCMVKTINASKGYTGDANLDAWSNTILKIKNTYPNLKTVIPGHGAHGGIELLDYTQKLFQKD